MDERKLNEQVEHLKSEIEKQQLRQEQWNDAEHALRAISGVIHILRSRKPEGRSEVARRYAVTITEMEKVYAYFFVYVYDQADPEPFSEAPTPKQSTG